MNAPPVYVASSRIGYRVVEESGVVLLRPKTQNGLWFLFFAAQGIACCFEGSDALFYTSPGALSILIGIVCLFAGVTLLVVGFGFLISARWLILSKDDDSLQIGRMRRRMPWRKTVVNIQSFSAAVIEAVPVDGDAAPCQLRLILAADSKDGPAVVLRGKYSSLHGIATALTNQFGLPVKDHAAHKQPSTRFSWKLPTLFAWKWDAAFRSKPQASPQASPKNPPRQSTVK